MPWTTSSLGPEMVPDLSLPRLARETPAGQPGKTTGWQMLFNGARILTEMSGFDSV